VVGELLLLDGGGELSGFGGEGLGVLLEVETSREGSEGGQLSQLSMTSDSENE